MMTIVINLGYNPNCITKTPATSVSLFVSNQIDEQRKGNRKQQSQIN